MTSEKKLNEQRRRRAIEIADYKEPYRLVMKKIDWLIIIAMMLIYSVMAFVNLGTLNTPETFWRSEKIKDTFIVDLGKEYNISRMSFFCGAFDGTTVVRYKKGDGGYTTLTALENEAGSFFKVCSSTFSSVNARYLQFDTSRSGSQIYEVAIYEDGSENAISGISVIEDNTYYIEGNGTPQNLFDEPERMPYSINYMNSTYFDEIYHARTAYEHLNGIRPYEWTHPPLGKLLIAAGMAIFGENMFGARFMGTFFGVLMLLVMYMFGKKITNNSRFAGFTAAFLMMFDFMHFTHSRISSIDVYAVFFVIMMFYFMYDFYINIGYNMSYKKSLGALLLSGFFMGCAMSVKWNTAYGVIGLALLFFITIYKEVRDYNILKEHGFAESVGWTKNFFPLRIASTLIFCIGAFIILPFAIYLISYTPYFYVTNGSPYTFNDVMELQLTMFKYHSTLDATHSFQSAWYTWPVIGRPLYMYASSMNPEGMRGTIVTMGNPAVWWMGVVAVIMSAMVSWKKRDKKMVPVFIAIATLFLPWMLVSRCTFIYHYFPVLPFVILCIAYMLNDFKAENKQNRQIIYAYFAVVVILFVMFYPALSGVVVSEDYINNWLRWFPSWGF